jgi:hypothetical protein
VSAESKIRGARREFCMELPVIMNKAGALGLYRTLHALHEAVRAVGYEVAELEDGTKARPYLDRRLRRKK